MQLDLFDVNLYIGRPTRELYAPVSTIDELLVQLDRQRISRALVWHVAQRDASPVTGNAMLSAAIAGQDRLWGCWTILPPQTGEVIRGDHDFFGDMRANRIVALRAFPELHRYLLNCVVFGRWMDQIVERRIPLLLSMEHGVTWPAVYGLLEAYPALTCILCDVGIWGVDRYTWPLLENYPSVHLETSLVALEDGGMEATVARYGAKRLVFGTGFPERYPESAILQLLHAEISDDDKQKIASGNLQDLLARVVL
ncbi:MAG: hypothetical protein M1434_02295 [Chloroflexi bacterium]|nr:hypothetical protein [Chloroflexota bacterium]MCL5273560.1 hypothetical protein [Chloroflexota bacterium]